MYNFFNLEKPLRGCKCQETAGHKSITRSYKPTLEENVCVGYYIFSVPSSYSQLISLYCSVVLSRSIYRSVRPLELEVIRSNCTIIACSYYK